ncbi:unnamed protein product [Closterium sp. Yama58-4]|nr:unnamed protein product [Closterium sp. Yama58-4]
MHVQGSPLVHVFQAVRELYEVVPALPWPPGRSGLNRDYLGDAATVDMAYNALLDHAMVEKGRSPHVIMKVVALLKKYLFRYGPAISTLEHIDGFCADVIAELKAAQAARHRLGNAAAAAAGADGPTAESGPALIKSLLYGVGSLGNRQLCVRERAYPPPRAPSDLPHLEPLRTVADGSAAAVLLGVNVVQLEAEGSPDLLHFDTVTGTVDPVLVRNHIRHITITKRLKADPTGAAGDGLQSSMKRRRPLFQYRYYSEQQPLRLSEGEMEEVMAAVCSVAATAAAGGAGGAGAHGSARLSSPAHHMVPQVDAADVAASVLIKMLIDMYLVDPRSAAPLALSMMHALLSSSKPTVRVRAFDLMLNLGVHAHLLHPLPVEDEAGQPYSSDADAAEAERGAVRRAAAVTMFEEWLLGLLCHMALYLVQVEESDESVWAAALSCVLYLTCDRGRTVFHRLALLDVRVLASLLEISIVHGWAQAVHTHLVRMLACLLYAAPHHTAQHPPGRGFEAARDGLRLDLKQLERVGGISFICCHYAASQEVEARRNLFAVVMDYVALLCRLHAHPHHPDNPPPSEAELAAVVAALVAAGAPEALVVALKAPSPPAGPIGAALARTIAAPLPPDTSAAGFSLQALHLVTDTLDDLISAHLRLPPEFTAMLQCTLASDGPPPDPPPSSTAAAAAAGAPADEAEVGRERRAWGTLRALLHSQRAVDRRNGLTWLLHLLLQQLPNLAPYQQPLLSDPQDGQQQQHAQAQQHKGGRVRSDNTAVRRGFVTVLEQLLLLHAAETEQESRESRGAAHAAAAAAAEAPEGPMGMEERRAADEAAASATAVQHQGAQDLLAVMSSALWQVMSCNDSDRVNILQMCSVMLWQLCVPRFLPTAQVVEPGSPVPSPGGSSWLVNPRVAAVAGGEGGGAMSPPYAAEESESMARLFLLRRAAAARELLAALPTALLYWPLMQLAPSAGDPIALATAVGSHGIVGAGGAVDVRVALLLLLIGKCSDSSEALEEVGGDAFFRSLLDDPDARIAYWSAAFLVKRMMSQQPDVYRRALHRLIFTAQQTNNEKLLENPYLQMRGILQDTPDALHLTS